MPRQTINYGEVKQSIRDLTKIRKPKNPRAFVEWFVKRYNIQKGFENELTEIVKDELRKLKEAEGSK